MLNQVTKLNNGRIVLINGDCLTWLPQIRSKANMIFADLPYGKTNNHWDCRVPLDQLWPKLLALGYAHTSYLFTAAMPYNIVLGASNLKMLKYDWVWEKPNGTGFLNAQYQPLRCHEHILVFYNKPPTYNPQMVEAGYTYTATRKFYKKQNATYGQQVPSLSKSSIRYPRSVQLINHVSRYDSIHPTQKPVELLEYLIKTYTNENDLVIDPTMGVGTTGVACAKLNRRFIGIELDTTEGYYETAIDRIQEVLNANPI